MEDKSISDTLATHSSLLLSALLFCLVSFFCLHSTEWEEQQQSGEWMGRSGHPLCICYLRLKLQLTLLGKPAVGTDLMNPD